MNIGITIRNTDYQKLISVLFYEKLFDELFPWKSRTGIFK